MRRSILASALAVIAVACGSTTGSGQDASPTQTSDTGAAEAQPPEERSFTWDLSWSGWNGLQYEVRQRVSIGGPDQLIPYQLINERVGLKGRIGAKLAIDGAAFFTTGGLSDIDNGVEVRRARLYTMGEIYLIIPIYYKVEISYIGDVGVVVEENYLGVKNVPVVQSAELIVRRGLRPLGLPRPTPPTAVWATAGGSVRSFPASSTAPRRALGRGAGRSMPPHPSRASVVGSRRPARGWPARTRRVE